jgi:hypothetical protein
LYITIKIALKIIDATTNITLKTLLSFIRKKEEKSYSKE